MLNYKYRAGSLYNLAMQLPLPVLPIKQGSLNYFRETLRKTLEDHWHC